LPFLLHHSGGVWQAGSVVVERAANACLFRRLLDFHAGQAVEMVDRSVVSASERMRSGHSLRALSARLLDA